MKLLLPLVLSLAAVSASAQRPDGARIAIRYKFLHVRDTTHRDRPYTENMILLVGSTSGVYKSNEGPAQQQVSNNPDGTTRTDMHFFGTHVEYYQFPNEKKLIRADWIPMTTFIITDALPAIDWHIMKDTASFGGLHCQKATAHVKGRDYTVWFCPDLPLHIGPWKLNGLPGVIVEAYDAKNEVRFTFDGVVTPAQTTILPPAKGVKTTDKDFANLQETARKDPEAYSKLMAQYNVGNGPKVDIKPGSGPVINNPIELPEYK